MRTLPHEGLETRRVILLRILSERHPEVLLGSEGAHCTLPQVQIARWQRVAEHLTAAFKGTCGIDAVSVSSIETYPPESHSEQIIYEIMEPHEPRGHAPHDKHWVAVDSLDESGFHDRNDFQAVRQAVARSIAKSEDSFRGPFARLGWFHELERWVQEEIAPQGLLLSGRFCQFNAYPTFSLIRFETNGPAFWFKAVDEPNQREYPITLALARLFSEFLPEIIATRPEWHGWVSRESEGGLLKVHSTPEAWKAVARDLADLQIKSVCASARLLELGALDLRTQSLADLVEPFFRALGDMMERHNEIPSVLAHKHICHLGTRIGDALAVLDDTNLPDTLGHLDINPGNIVCSPNGSVFLDWAEAFVGHPILTFEYLLEHSRRAFGRHHQWEAEVVEAYSSRWRNIASKRAIQRAREVAPLAALFACAAGNGVWKDQGTLLEPHTVRHLLNLLRRMEREACLSVGEGMACRSY